MEKATQCRLAAALVVALLAGLAAWAEPVHDLAAHVANGRMSDIGLYQAVARQVGMGADFYQAAVRLQRANGFPLHPFVTVRLPTLAFVTGHIGYGAALALAGALLASNAVIWFGAIPFARPAERICVLALLMLGSLMVPQAVYLHEWWAGQLLTGSLGLHLREWHRAGLVLSIAALFIREHSALFVAASLFCLLDRQRRGELAAAVAALVALCLALLLHRAQVMPLVVPSDPTSPGWLGLRGPAGPSADLQAMVLFDLVPEPMGSLLVFAPLLGWAEVAMRRSALPLVWFGGFLLVLAVLARADNVFWVRMILPGYMVGLAFVPRALGATLRPGSGGAPYPMAEQQVHLP